MSEKIGTAEETTVVPVGSGPVDRSTTLFKLAGAFLLLATSLAGTPFSDSAKLVIFLLFVATTLGLIYAGLRERRRVAKCRAARSRPSGAGLSWHDTR
jgi:hypothetical protein